MSKRRYIQNENGDFVEVAKDKKGQWHYVMPDIQPYKSMIDGRMITSRSEHRSHLKAHGCMEIGNEDPLKHVSKAVQQKTSRVEVLKQQLANMTHKDANRLLSRLRDEIRFTHDPHRR